MRDPRARERSAPAPTNIAHRWLVGSITVVTLVGIGLTACAAEPSVTDETAAVSAVEAAPTAIVGVAPPKDVAALLSCLPVDPAGWSRSEALPAMADDRAALATAGDTAVAVGIGTDRKVEAYWSRDGVEWVRAEGFPEARVVGESPPAVAGGTTGFVAVVIPDIHPGVAPMNHPDTPPIVAFSDDGTTWDVLDPETLPDHGVLWLSDVHAGPAGFLITGAITTDLTDVGIGAFAWSSHDGRSWSAADYPIDSWSYPTVVATDTGWAALTEAVSADGMRWRGAVWRSADGVSWHEAETPSRPPGGGYPGDFRALPTAVRGTTWVAATTLQRGGEPTVWRSTDDGATWTRLPIGGAQGASEHAFWDMASTPYGLLLTGRYDFGRDHTSVLHYSTDGTRWWVCSTPRSGTGTAADFTEIAMLGDTLITLDSGTGIFHVWNDPDAQP